MSKAAPVRINKHRTKIIDLRFTDKYLPGKEMPADYNSRHPNPIASMTKQERERKSGCGPVNDIKLNVIKESLLNI